MPRPEMAASPMYTWLSGLPGFHTELEWDDESVTITGSDDSDTITEEHIYPAEYGCQYNFLRNFPCRW
jgi:hypothetical protein